MKKSFVVIKGISECGMAVVDIQMVQSIDIGYSDVLF